MAIELFTLENHQVQISPELRNLEFIKKLIKRDKDREKRNALAQLSYVYFMYDYKSPYSAIPRDEKEEKIKRHLNLTDDFKVDAILQEVIDFYTQHRDSESVKALKSTREALLSSSRLIDKINELVTESLLEDDPDLEEIEKRVEALLKLAAAIPKTVAVIKTLEEEVIKEQTSGLKIRGGGKAGEYED
jgi:hypothetical protein